MKMQSYFISLSKASRSFILSMLAVITPFYLARFVGVFDVGIIVLFSIAFSTLIIYLLPALKAKNGTKNLFSIVPVHFNQRWPDNVSKIFACGHYCTHGL